MTVNEQLMKLGRWGFKLSSSTPREVLDKLDYFGHIAISTGRTDPRVADDSLLTSARYVGVLRSRQLADEGSTAASTFGGVGMAMWLGDEDKKGAVLENATAFASGSFTSVINGLLPSSGAVVAGTVHSVTGVYTNTHVFQDPRTAIDYVCGYFTGSSSDPVEWRVNGDGTLDAGKVSQLYVTTPKCAIVRRGAGVDMALRGLQGKASTTRDVDDFTTRVVLVASGSGASVATGSADINPSLNGYKDIRGNTVVMTRMVSESATSQGNATSRAQLALSQFTTARTALTLSTAEYDVKGDVAVGDAVWLWNPDVGLEDPSNEVTFRGMRLQPLKLRLVEMTWPVTKGMSVAYRDKNGAWTDLTDYVQWESSTTTLVVGGVNRTLTSSSETVGSRPVPDTSIPAAPTFVLPFRQAVYQSQATGITKAQVQVEWVKPNNTDGTLVLDGDKVEIQYRTGSTPIFPATHSQMSAYTHDELADGTHDQPITFEAGPWQSAWSSFDDTSQLLHELTPGVPYDIRVRAYDNATPPNVSDWSSTTTIQTVGDTVAPTTPAAAEVAASLIAVQITHTLGRSDGGTYNMDADLNHLEIHAQYTPNFTPDDTTRIGKLLANKGMMLGEIPAVGTFPVEFTEGVYVKVIAVDDAGNKSSPSTAAQSTVLLIDDAHISDLTVSKVTAGTITAQWVNSGRIWSGVDNGARVQLVADGLEAYNSSNQRTIFLNAATGEGEFTGRLKTSVTQTQRVEIAPSYTSAAGQNGPAMLLYDDNSSSHVVVWANDNNFVLSANKNSDETFNGGMLFFDLVDSGDGSAYLGYSTASDFLKYYHQVGSSGDHRFKGKFGAQSNLGGESALYCGAVTGGSGAQSFSITYGATMSSAPAPLIQVNSSNDTEFNYHTYNRSTTGFTFRVGTNVGGTWDCFFWCFRY